jgi:hypothetical protein
MLSRSFVRVGVTVGDRGDDKYAEDVSPSGGSTSDTFALSDEEE